MASNGSNNNIHPPRNDDGSSKAGETISDLSQPAIANEKVQMNLTDANKAAINRGENSIKDHVLEKDISAIEIEIAGGKIEKSNGLAYNHLEEGKNTMKALSKSIVSLSNSLNNTNLDKDNRRYLKHERDRFMMYYKLLENAFKGGKKWKQ